MSSEDPQRTPVLLCFDGSEDADAAITAAGRLLATRTAVVLTVWEPVAVWEPYDPATILNAPLARLASNTLRLDEIARELAEDKQARGIALAASAGFVATGQIARGKTWKAICAVAEELAADPIVLGARGLGRVESALLGSVSAAVVQHARRPVLVVPAH